MDTRLQLHWAAQAAAGVGRTILPKQPDDSHTNFSWCHERHALMQGDGRSGIRVRDLTLLFGDEEYPLAGRTLDDAFRFFEERVGKMLERPGEATPPDHPVAQGRGFEPSTAGLERLSMLYEQADIELRRINTPVRCWPHHFDLATLIHLGGGRTIGAGFSPGDGQFSEPYWYVTPWPYPADRTNTKSLPAGFWNNEPWFGAVLPASSDANVAEFLDAAIIALR